MKVLVIGKAGQIARSLAAAKKPSGLELTAVGRPDIDLTVPASVAWVYDSFAPDLVINAAAYTAVDKAESEPETAFAINAEGAGVIAETCATRRVPLIHLSTDYVFDGRKTGAYREDDTVGPLGVYGCSKLEGERRVAATWPRHLILRTAWVISPHGRNFVKTMLGLAQSRAEIGVVDDQVGNPTYAPHLAIGILAVAQRLVSGEGKVAPRGIYHAAGAGEATWCDLAREVFVQSASMGGPSAAVRPAMTAEYPTTAQRPPNSCLDCAKLADTFGVRLPNWRVGVSECVRVLSQDGRAAGSFNRTAGLA